jgi:hypothetical protein
MAVGRRGWGILVFAIAFALYASYGLDGVLRRDDANCLYAGQRIAAGVPPYVGMFTMAAPVSQLLAAVGQLIARAVDTDDLYTTRVLFLSVAALAIAAAYRLGLSVFRGPSGAVLTALTMLSFRCFALGSVAGPQKKVPVVLFEILALWLTIERRWLLAGAAGALSALTWQPMIVLPIVTLVLASTAESQWRSIGAAVLGASAPVVALGLYAAFHGALRPMVAGVVLLPFHYLSRPPVALHERLARPLRAMFETDAFGGVSMSLGILGCLFFYPSLSAARTPLRAVVDDRLAAILLSLPAPIVWSLVDFQHCPDLYVLYPYAALGVSALILTAAHRIEARVPAERRRFARLSLVGGVGICIVAISLVAAIRHRDSGLQAQRAAALEIERRMGREGRLVSVGAPEALVLLHRVNPNPYPFIIDGIGQYIAATKEGGFDAFIRELASHDPDVIAFGPTGGHPTKLLVDWITSRYQRIRLGPMTFFVRKGDPRLTTQSLNKP